MSLVGPRPLLMQYLERYTPEQSRRHEVLPGITGWAQVKGRNAITWDEKFALDVWYVDHWSLWLDFRILLLTVWKILRREGSTSRAMQQRRSSGPGGRTMVPRCDRETDPARRCGGTRAGGGRYPPDDVSFGRKRGGMRLLGR